MPTLIRYFLIPLFTLVLGFSYAQSKREISTVEIPGEMVIDAKFNEPQWSNTEVSSDFIQRRPNPGDPASYKTEVRVLYGQKSLYIAMEMFDPHPDSILHQLSERDDIGNTSWAGVIIGGFQDGINAFEYFATVEGVQFDASLTAFGEDPSWNSVWTSATAITDEGWALEIEIQQWDINFCRTIRRKREQSFWNHINPEVNGFVNQMGVINGIKNIKPPTRLFFYPYAGLNYDVSKGADGDVISGETFTAGMDLKYGINNSFTLDATLVPDFGQVRNDDNVLNLSAFEVRFNENRQFFTEGTELFGKGDLFYSRRIGGSPVNIDKVYDKEDEGFEIDTNPTKTKLLNAVKLSGRNKNGLGVGVFNAVTNASNAVIRDSLGNEQNLETAPVTNYSVIVLDQNLKNNSYISLINTNVLRNGNTYDANVTGTVFNIRNKANKYSLEGGMAYSNKFNFGNDEEKDGFNYNLGLAEVDGKLNYGVNYEHISPHFDSNDLGFLRYSNEKSSEIWVNYNEYKPTKHFNNYWMFSKVEHSLLAETNAFSGLEFLIEGGANTKKFNAFGLGSAFDLKKEHDFYETRNISKYFERPINTVFWGWVSSDYRKRLAMDANANINLYAVDGWYGNNFSLRPRFRFNDHLLVRYSFNYENDTNERGYADTLDDDDQIIFSKRDVNTRVNVLSGQYVFNNKMGLTFRLRHYWSSVQVKEFFELTQDGLLTDTEFDGFEEDGTSEYNQNFNAITTDVGYRWVFAPGSELSLVWKANLSDFKNERPKNFGENFKDAADDPSINSFSVKLLYFIDYLSLKKKA
jgi:hypothetical protein